MAFDVRFRFTDTLYTPRIQMDYKNHRENSEQNSGFNYFYFNAPTKLIVDAIVFPNNLETNFNRNETDEMSKYSQLLSIKYNFDG